MKHGPGFAVPLGSRPHPGRRLLTGLALVLVAGAAGGTTGCGGALVRVAAWSDLTGHPAIALRAGFLEDSPVDFMITGRLYDEGTRDAQAADRGTTSNATDPSDPDAGTPADASIDARNR